MPSVLEPPDVITLPGIEIGTGTGHDDETDEWLDVDKPWNVILHNDDVNPFDAVIYALVNIVGLDIKKAVEATNHIHKNGKGIVATEHLEKAELIKSQLEDFTVGPFNFKLTVSLEQAA